MPIWPGLPLQCPSCRNVAAARTWDVEPPLALDGERHSPGSYVLKCPRCGATPTHVLVNPDRLNPDRKAEARD